MYRLILLLFIASRMLDLLSTYFVTDDLSTETSPLVTILNMSWLGLIITNIILISIIITSTIFFKRKENKLIEIENKYKNKMNSFKDYFIYILFKEDSNKLWINKQVMLFPFLYFFFFSTLYTMTICSILVSINNFMIFFDLYSLHMFSDETLHFTMFAINLIILVCIFFIIVRKRYSKLLS